MSGGQDKKRCVACKELHHPSITCELHKFETAIKVHETPNKINNSRDLARSHWIYTGQVLELTQAIPENLMSLVKYLYIEAMVHGYKHAVDDKTK